MTELEKTMVWMSYRYCIGRHTIAAHCHAGDLANFIYDKTSDEYKQFLSEDINSEIANQLTFGILSFENRWSIPRHLFKPLEILYDALTKAEIDSPEKYQRIKEIEVYYDTKKGFTYSTYFWDEPKMYKRSLMDIQDLEVWQRLANLLDTPSHKKCTLTDGTEVEYYEYTILNTYGGTFQFEKIKSPIEKYHNFVTNKFIPDDAIAEEN
jgi:hypothetical protein